MTTTTELIKEHTQLRVEALCEAHVYNILAAQHAEQMAELLERAAKFATYLWWSVDDDAKAEARAWVKDFENFQKGGDK